MITFTVATKFNVILFHFIKSTVALLSLLILLLVEFVERSNYTSEVGVIMRNGALPRVGDQKTVRTLDGRDVAIEDLPVFLRPKNNVVPVGTLWIKPGDRIAQLVLAPVIRPLKITAGKIAPTSLDSEFGFASSITKRSVVLLG